MKFNLRLLITVFILSITFTLLSFSYQRFGPEIGYLGADCKPDCVVLKLNAGWPLPYVFDKMGVSVLNVLHLEDEFRLAPFILDIVFYAVVLYIIKLLIDRRKSI